MKNKDLNTVIKTASPLLLSLLLSACVSNASESSDTAKVNDAKTLKKSADTPIQERTLEPTSPTNSVSKMTKGEQIEHCKNDLAKQLSIELSEISVLTTRPVTWRSGALGCPEEGAVYTQAQVAGRIIALAAGDEVYRYHTAVNGTPFSCPNGRAESPLVNPGDL